MNEAAVDMFRVKIVIEVELTKGRNELGLEFRYNLS